MKILVFEFICGGGCYSFPGFGLPQGSLWHEGKQMLSAVLEELRPVPGLDLFFLLDKRCTNPIQSSVATPLIVDSALKLERYLDAIGGEYDKLFLIAPEIDNALLYFTSRISSVERLMCPGRKVVELCSDKWTTHNFLISQGLPTPRTFLEAGQAFDNRETRFVSKPRLGAGSQYVGILDLPNRNTSDNAAGSPPHANTVRPDSIIQEFVRGIPSSIAIWRTTTRSLIFPAMKQCFAEGSFEVVDFEGPLPDSHQRRAESLLERVVEALPPFQGYLGVDLILDEADVCQRDMVIEINPRLTTSFCRTRDLIDKNRLTQLILEQCGMDEYTNG